jgi:sugar (pentulose or hexulose) kinase
MKRTNTIAIDCGNSFIKTALIRTDTGEILGQASAITAVSDTERDNGVTQIGKTAHIVKNTIYTYLKESDADQTILSMCTEMHGFVLTDFDFKPVTDYISWKDERCLADTNTDWLRNFCSNVSGADIMNTGMPLKAGLPSVNLYYYINTKLASYDTKRLRFLTLGDYLTAVITGKPPVAHSTSAAGTGLYSVTKGEYNRSLIENLGCADIVFPIVDDKIAAVVKADGGELLVLPPAGDQQTALLGTGLALPAGRRNVQLSINMGTGAQVSVVTLTADFSSDYQIRPFFDGAYIKSVPHIPSGRALNVFFGFVRECCAAFAAAVDDGEIWDFIFREADKRETPDMCVDLSFFTNPVTKNTKGGLSNIDENGFTVGNLFASAFKQMAENVRVCADRITDRNKISMILFSGGIVAKNAKLRDLIMSHFNAANYVVGENETFRGLNMLAQRAIEREIRP